jgi:hypothetical protein
MPVLDATFLIAAEREPDKIAPFMATLNEEGVYVYKCDPHFAMGMAGVVVVGEPTNFEQVKADAQGMARRVVNQAEQAMKEKGML